MLIYCGVQIEGVPEEVHIRDTLRYGGEQMGMTMAAFCGALPTAIDKKIEENGAGSRGEHALCVFGVTCGSFADVDKPPYENTFFFFLCVYIILFNIFCFIISC